MYQPTELAQWQSILKSFTPAAILRWAVRQFGPSLTFWSTLSREDQVLTSLISEQDLHLSIFVIDTGRLPEESYSLLENTVKRYTPKIRLYFPDWEDVESMIGDHGPNLFKQSIPLRKKCCFVRKERPLRRALAGKSALLTGLRREMTPDANTEPLEWDPSRELYKINPLWNWSEAQLTEYVERNQVEVNSLHSQGFARIGCEPCSRAISINDDPGAGQWWWEQSEETNHRLTLSPRSNCPTSNCAGRIEV